MTTEIRAVRCMGRFLQKSGWLRHSPEFILDPPRRLSLKPHAMRRRAADAARYSRRFQKRYSSDGHAQTSPANNYEELLMNKLSAAKAAAWVLAFSAGTAATFAAIAAESVSFAGK